MNTKDAAQSMAAINHPAGVSRQGVGANMEQHPPPTSAPDQADPTQPGDVQRYNDDFMMFVFKVEMCKRVDKHDREKCPYAHPGELARRRHPTLYQALPCPEARAKKICPRLENCNCSHSTFEFWLHPDRYKTFLCERGTNCNRPICFFAHNEEELRELPQGLQRTTPTHKPSAGGSSSAGGASSSSSRHHHQQHQHTRLPAGAAGRPGNMIFMPGNAAHPQGYMTQAGGAYGPQMQQQGSQSGPVMSYVPVMQQQQQQGLQQQQQQGLQQQMPGMQYVAVPVQQPTRSSDGSLAGGPQGPSAVMQQQLVYAPRDVQQTSGPGQEWVLPGHSGSPHRPGAEVVAAPAQLQVQHTYSYPQMGYAGAMQGPPHVLQGNPGMYAQPPQQQQMMIGYQPVQMANTPGYAGHHGVVMVRPGSQRGSTVAVVAAGPSAWSGTSLAADPGEAPSLEALCAAMNQMAVPTNDSSNPELLLQQYQQQGGQQQQQVQVPEGVQPVMVVMRPEGQAQVGWTHMQPGP